MSNDTTFITNKGDDTLLNRFNTVLKSTEMFDCLVGYFYISGFYKLQKEFESVSKIRILVGMGVDRKTFDVLEESKNNPLPTKEIKTVISNNIVSEMNKSADNLDVEKGVEQIIEWIKCKKLEIRAYGKKPIHSKIYIMTFDEDDRDKGRVITGSSNFTMPGLENNIEFNVELKNSSDYEFAKDEFEALWKDSIEVTEDYINTITKKTWITKDITPYELFLKFIYEYLYEKIDNDKEKLLDGYYPEKFKSLEYQQDAVLEAKKIIEEHNGVFLSDVVGLGKTYMGILLLKQLKGKSLIIAPPTLTDEHNPGGWKRVAREFDVNATIESKGKLNHIIENYDDNYFSNILIDESHNFRNEESMQYDLLSTICHGKKVILVSATPYNNTPNDILAQLKLFQNSHNSSLPNPKVRDLNQYFKSINQRIKNIDKKDDPIEFKKVNQEVSADIRENILQYLMIRRTRNDIKKYYSDDLEKNNLKFPKVKEPIPIYYEFDEEIDNIFTDTLYILTKQLTYAKYLPLSEKYAVKPEKRYQSSQNMMSNFIKILLIKRLESSIKSFKNSIDNAINTHKLVIKTFKEENCLYTSKDYNEKIYEFIDSNKLDEIDIYVNKGKAKKYDASQFKPEFIEDLEKDLELLKKMQNMWNSIEEYPKNHKLTDLLNNELKDKKVIIFTEFIDTAEALEGYIKERCTDRVLTVTGKSTSNDREEVIDNFDANKKSSSQKDDYDILITSDVLSHGMNLHRSNILINYDIPWNPTKMMQRAGRVQRLDTSFDEIYIYNFFPTEKIEEHINIEKIAETKISSFIELLGNDSQLLTDEPIQSNDLFTKINTSPDDLEEEEDPELKYLSMLRDIRDNDKELFYKIEHMPKKSRVAIPSEDNSVISLLKSNKYMKIFKTDKDHTEELTFIQAIDELKSTDSKTAIIDNTYYDYLNKNMDEFKKLITDISNIQLSRNEKTILKPIKGFIKNKKDTNTKQVEYLKKVKKLIKEGVLSNNQIKKINKGIKENNDPKNPDILINILKNNIPDSTFKNMKDKEKEEQLKIDVVLSQYHHKE